MTGNYLARSQSDAAHAVLAAVGYNFELLLKWQSLLCALILTGASAASGRKLAFREWPLLADCVECSKIAVL